jgi:hypothetical protein
MIDQHTFEVYTQEGVQVDVTDGAGTLTMDLGWSPHVQASLRLPATVPALNIEAGDRLIVHLLQRTGSISFLSDLNYLLAGGNTTPANVLLATGTTTAVIDNLITAGNYNSPPMGATSRRFDLIVSSSPSRSRQQVSIALASEEHLHQSILWYWPTDLTITAPTAAGMLGQAFTELDARYGPYTPPPIANIATADTHNLPPIVVKTGDSVFSEIVRRIAVLRQRFYSPGDGTMVLRAYPWTPTLALQTFIGEGLNLIDFELQPGGDEQFMVSFIDPADATKRVYYVEAEGSLNELPPRQLIAVDSIPINPLPAPPGSVGLAVEPRPWQPFMDRQRKIDSPDTLTAISNYRTRPGEQISLFLDELFFLPVVECEAVQFTLGGNQMTVTI